MASPYSDGCGGWSLAFTDGEADVDSLELADERSLPMIPRKGTGSCRQLQTWQKDRIICISNSRAEIEPPETHV